MYILTSVGIYTFSVFPVRGAEAGSGVMIASADATDAICVQSGPKLKLGARRPEEKFKVRKRERTRKRMRRGGGRRGARGGKQGMDHGWKDYGSRLTVEGLPPEVSPVTRLVELFSRIAGGGWQSYAAWACSTELAGGAFAAHAPCNRGAFPSKRGGVPLVPLRGG